MKYALTLLFIVQLFASCSSQNGISKAKAYVRQKIAGTIPVDDNGRPRQSGVSEEHLVFVETDSAKPAPVFATAWVKQKPYAVRPVQIPQPAQPIGKTTAGKEIILAPKAGHTLWQLVLMPTNESTAKASLTEKILQNQFVLTGTWQGKDFVYAFNKEERLEPLQFQ